MHQIDSQELRTTSVLNGYTAPGYSPIELLHTLERKVQGHGGHLDHLYTYIDSKSAVDWVSISTQTEYFQFAGGYGFPFTWAAKNVYAKWKKMGYSNIDHVEVIALGSGDGLRETKMVEALVAAHPSLKRLDLSLLDISPQLLCWGHKRASSVLQDEPRVHIVCVQGNFSDLSMYSDLYFAPEQMKRPRLVLLLGGTFSNLDNELSFIKSSLGGFPTGTLFLADYFLGFAPANSPSDIIQKDPYLSMNMPIKWFKAIERFLVGPFKRYRNTPPSRLLFKPTLDSRSLIIPGSYAIELNVEVTNEDNITHTFGFHRIKRFEGKYLVDAIESLGWKSMAGVRFAPQWETYLFCKQ